MLRSWDEVFDVMGGPAEVGRAIGTTTEHAASMRRRGRIPSPYWFDLCADAAARGIEKVTTDTLAEIERNLVAEKRQPAEAH